jgi:hypothetical protein
MFDGTDITARRICEVSPHCSLRGKLAVIRYTLSTKSILRCHTNKS